MASTALSLLPITEDVLNFDDSNLNLELDPDFSSTTSVLDLLSTFSPDFANLVADFAADLDEISGQIVVTGGVFDANLLLADGTPWLGSFDAPTTLTDLANLAAITNGTFTLVDGMLEATVTTGEESLALEGLDLANLTSLFVLDTLNSLEATVPIENGAFSFETTSLLGPVSGTLDFGGGDLNIDLNTPFGPLSADIDFGEEALFPFTIPVPFFTSIDGVVDFNTGNIVVGVGPLGDIAIPLDSLSGTLSLADGVASLAATAPIATGIPFMGNITAPINVDVEIGPLASEAVADFIDDLTATGTLTNGLLDAVLDSPFGLLETTFDLVAFTNQGADFFAGLDGLIDIGGGLLTADLTTPLGDVNGTLNLVDAAGWLDAPVAGLI